LQGVVADPIIGDRLRCYALAAHPGDDGVSCRGTLRNSMTARH
jgi:hypothetical protein